MKRRDALKQIGLLGSALSFSSCSATNRNRLNTKKSIFKNSLNFKSILKIPEIEPYSMENNYKKFDFNIKEGTSKFLNTKVPTFGVNSDYLGTTLRVKTKDLISMNVKNLLDEETTCHWHGWHVDGKHDGSMHQSIFPDEVWNPKFMVNNHAGTYFYHSHVHGKTGEQVYKGIAGMIIVDDDISDNLKIPKEYGVDDIPLIIQDKFFDNEGNMPYLTGFRTKMMGHFGNTYMVNGVISPSFKANKTLTRFRILNGSNARTLYLSFSDERNFYQIATDGGLMEKSLKSDIVRIAPAERIEILVDLSDKIDDLFLVNKTADSQVKIMKIDSQNAKTSEYKIPKKLVKIDWIKEKEATKHRNMLLSMRRGALEINHKSFSHSRIDEKVKLNSTEIWTIKTISGPMAHPFHIHGTSFQVLSRNGKEPLASERGWKDVVLVESGEEVKVIMRFNYKANKHNPYMYHCHILEHEDMGMMGQFTVS